MKNLKKILILGADGFIGSNLVNALIKEGYDIRGFDLFRNGKSKNLEHLKEKIEFFPGNFLNLSDLANALKGIEYVFHLISLTTPSSSINDPIIDIETNIKGTVNLLKCCGKSKIKKIIFASSGGSIYGNQVKNKFTENDETNPISPYAISKLTIEKYLEYFRIQTGIDYLSLRFSNAYGPGQNIIGNQGIISIFLNLIKNNQEITIFGDGENIRDYIYIDDMVNATCKIIKKNTGQKIFNIGSGEGASINQLVDYMKKISGKKIQIKKMPARNSDVRQIVLDISKIKKEIGEIKKTPLEQGIKKTWEWINKNY